MKVKIGPYTDWFGPYQLAEKLMFWVPKEKDEYGFPHTAERVPSGTLKEFMRIQLVEDAYYITADRTSKSYARSLDFSNWSDKNLERHIERMCA